MNKMGDRIINDLSLQALPPEEQLAVVEKFSEVVFQGVLVRGMGMLDEKQKDALDAKLNAGGSVGADEVMEFLSDAIPDFSAIVEEETESILARAKNTITPDANAH